MRRFTIVALVLTGFQAQAQSAREVSEVITDFGGLWKSAKGSLNSIKPDNSHNLLAFTYKGKTFSTGANDDKLTKNGVAFTKGYYVGYFFSNEAVTATSNTKIALGASYDGVANGASNPAPTNSISKYLSDGLNGLDLGTGVANMPKGDLVYDAKNILPAAIGDDVPDILVTQIADPSNSVDSYEFLDKDGNLVGGRVNIAFTNISTVGKWTADFYEASKTPMALGAGYTKTERDLRLWAADFADFGLTKDNISQVRTFVIHLNGNSDLAFVAYNANAFYEQSPYGDIVPLPVTLTSFTAKQLQEQVQLSWSTASEKNSSHFEIMASTDGRQFATIGKVNAAGNSNVSLVYTFKYTPATSEVTYYRLKQVDLDDTFEYSKIIAVTLQERAAENLVYPNPVSGSASEVILQHAATGGNIEVWNLAGEKMLALKAEPGTVRTILPVQNLPKGIYLIVCQANGSRESTKLVIQ
ncbi:T9SS type A sorting domain-containing protein [Pontibacter oryzae]|nr:T9SS type A sorting domain-containing protein [Pontibacter oryzae]